MPPPPHGDVAVLVGEQYCGADALVAAAGRVGAVDAGQHRDAQLVQFGMAVKGRARTAPVGIELFLLGEFNPAAVDQPDQRDVKPFGKVGHPQECSLTGREARRRP